MSSRAQIVLWYSEGYRKGDIAAMSGASRPTVDKWLKRYEELGMEGLVSRTSPGGPRQIPDRIRARVLALSRTSPPSALGISHWTSPEMARYIKKTEGVYVSQTWVSRLWREHGLAPWRQGTFKISTDPDFEDKVRDVVGLYLDPPEGEVVVSVDAKTGIQALDRTQSLLPIDFGKTAKRTFDYARMGTTDLYAAMDIRSGKVIASLSATHATPDFLRLMRKVVAAYPGQKVHVVLDNASVHLSADTQEWLTKQQGQVVFHFTPTGRAMCKVVSAGHGKFWGLVSRPRMVRSRGGLFLVFRMVAAMRVWPAWRISPITRLRGVAMIRGRETALTWEASSRNVTSRTQWILFSMDQCPRA